MQGFPTEKIFLAGLVTLATVFAVLIFWPFLTVILFAAALSVVLYPVYNWFNTKVTKNIRWLSSILTLAVFLVILCIPLTIMGITIFNQSQDFYQALSADGGSSGLVVRINEAFDRFLPPGISIDIQERIADLLSTFSGGIASVFTATLSTIFSLFLVILSMFYFLKDGAEWKKTLIRVSPLPDRHNHKIIEKLRFSIDGIIKGYLLIGLAQGILMGVGLALFGVPSPALWALFAAIASLVPTIGTALISIPAIIYLFATGETGSAIGLMVWAGVAVGTIDNLLNPIVVGHRIDIHPLLILFAILGGIAFMGPVGILIGPLVISFLYSIISIYREEETEVVYHPHS